MQHPEVAKQTKNYGMDKWIVAGSELYVKQKFL